MKRIFAGLLLAFTLLPVPLSAQTYPDHESRGINDFAGLLPPETEVEMTAELDKLREETGIEMTVVTLSRKDMFAPDQSIETFAAGLFDQWGVGGEGRDDGILFLILRADRQTRIELGRGYGGDWQREANAVIESAVLPEFRDGDYAAGIAAGLRETIARVAWPFHAEAPAPAPDLSPEASGGGVSGWWAALLLLPVGALILWGKMKAKLAKCPECGKRGLEFSSNRLSEPTETSEGRGERITECPACGYRKAEPFTIAKRARAAPETPPKPKEFGGGKSGGGGASGEW